MKRFGVLVFVFGLCGQVEAQFPFALSETGYGVSVASDPNGRVLLLGAFSEPVDFDPGPGDATVSPTGSDGYLAFYSEDGFFLEVLVLRAIVGSVSPTTASFADDGSFVLSGWFSGTADFDPGPGEHVYSVGGYSRFVARFNAVGELQFAFPLMIEVFGRRDDVIPGDTDYTLVAGTFEGTIDLDPGPSEALITSTNSTAVVVATYDSAGAYLSAFVLRADEEAISYQLSADPTGGFAIVGYAESDVDFDPGPQTVTLEIDGSYIARYDFGGSFRELDPLPPLPRYSFADTDFGVDGSVVITGTMGSPTDFDVGPGSHVLAAVGLDASYIARYDANHALIYAFLIEGDIDVLAIADAGVDVELTASNAVIATGYFTGEADFDPGPGTYLQTGSFTSYVARYSEAGDLEYAFTLDSCCGAGKSSPTLALGLETFVVSGWFHEDLDVDPGPGETILSGGFGSRYAAKYSQDGAIVVGTEESSGWPEPTYAQTRVYPNPFYSSTSVLMIPTSSGSLRIETFDLLGREVGLSAEYAVVAGQRVRHTLSGSSLAPGTYLLHIVDPTGTTTTRLITKAR